MREIYRDEFCRVIEYDNAVVGSRGKEVKVVSLASDFLPPHWPCPTDMINSYIAIEKVIEP